MATTPVPMPTPQQGQGSGQPTDEQTGAHNALQAFLAFVRNKRGAAPPGGAAQPTYQGSPGMPGVQMQPPQQGGMPTAAPAPGGGQPQGQVMVPQGQPMQPSRPQIGRKGSLVNSVADAIIAHKDNKDRSAMQHAEYTMNMFMTAMAADPPDYQTANLLANNQKIVKGWEKYITGELPRVPGGKPGEQAGVNQPGGLAFPVDPSVLAAKKAALAKAQADANKQAADAEQARGAGAKDQADAAKTMAGVPDIHATNLADIDYKNAQGRQADATARMNDAKAKLDAANAGDAHALAEAQIGYQNAQADDLHAQAALRRIQSSGGFTPAEINQVFTKDNASLEQLRNTAVANLKQLQTANINQGKTATGVIEKGLGITTDYIDEIKKAAAQVDQISKAIKYHNDQHGAMIKGTISPAEAYDKAYSMAGFGVPKAPLTAQEMQDYLSKANGDVDKAMALAKADGKGN